MNQSKLLISKNLPMLNGALVIEMVNNSFSENRLENLWLFDKVRKKEEIWLVKTIFY